MKTGLTFFQLSSAAVLAAATEFHVATNGNDAKERGRTITFHFRAALFPLLRRWSLWLRLCQLPRYKRWAI
jgi:hypothetical protein